MGPAEFTEMSPRYLHHRLHRLYGRGDRGYLSIDGVNGGKRIVVEIQSFDVERLYNARKLYFEGRCSESGRKQGIG
jgi:hypothetical protein